ncbi:hypothetical protein CLOP_g12787 [Closterium sp. NIES-67]|nr:hypothetical protein CLOP_g12787 [Closterium sp. NIES-67]
MASRTENALRSNIFSSSISSLSSSSSRTLSRRVDILRPLCLLLLLSFSQFPFASARHTANSAAAGASPTTGDTLIRLQLQTQAIDDSSQPMPSQQPQSRAFEIHVTPDATGDAATRTNGEEEGRERDAALGWEESEPLVGPPQRSAFERLAWEHLSDGHVSWEMIDPTVVKRFARRKHQQKRQESRKNGQRAAEQTRRRLLAAGPSAEGEGLEDMAEEPAWNPASAPPLVQRAFLDHVLSLPESPFRISRPAVRFANASSASSADISSPDRRRRGHERGRVLDDAPVPVSAGFRGLTPPGLNTGPSPADINITAYRYDSVPVRAWVDWRWTRFMTPVSSQIRCESCWALTATDSVALMWSIATFARDAVPLSAQQACDCAAQQCCEGGWPEWVLAYIVYNGGIASNDVYPYTASNQPTCDAEGASVKQAQITGWEQVPAFDVQAMVQAVSQHPVIAFLDASTTDFRMYRGGFYNGNCSVDVNHAVLIVGYGTDRVNGPYWVVKNTWGKAWGDNGYMYLAMTAGAGKCGINQIPPIYPVFFPKSPQPAMYPIGPLKDDPKYRPMRSSWRTAGWHTDPSANPCLSRINPCGGGACYMLGGLARCLCPRGFVERIGAPTSKCVTRDPCTKGVVNPCGAGKCNSVKAAGLYTCSCDEGYVIGSRVDGSPTCVPVTPAGGSLTYTTVPADTCQGVATALAIPANTLQRLNPFLDCSAELPSGMVLAVSNPTQTATSGCTTTDYVSSNDTCDSIATRHFKGDQEKLRKANPGLKCESLYVQQQLCAEPLGMLGQDVSPLVCGLTYTVTAGDTCDTISTTYALNNTRFYMLNPGLDCTVGQLPVGLAVCVGEQTSRDAVTCSKWYLVQQGDNCPNIWNAANLTISSFMAINPGLRCQAPYLQVGQLVCIASPTAVLVDSLTANSSLIPYKVQPNDNLTTIAMAFFDRCGVTAGEANLCHANNFFPCDSSAIEPDQLILVPCSRRIGLNDCGCSNNQNYVCGSDFATYPSMCDAVCNFATPVTPGPCNPCQSACFVRSGLMADTRFQSRCKVDLDSLYCPFPSWPPSQWWTMADTPCEYMETACNYVCTDTANTLVRSKASGKWATFKSQCMSQCMCTPRVPCGWRRCAS